MSAIVLRGDARALPLPDESVDLIVTSVPYWGLRDYTDGGASMPGQIGTEADPLEWLANLLEAIREWTRILKPCGSLFINCGDKYDSGTTTARINPGTVKNGQGQGWHQASPRISLGRPKSLLGLPWRVALACVDELGLILRRDIVWHKTNPLPESAGDRCASRHEYLFHLVKQPRYYAAIDEIREPHTGTAHPQKREPVGSASGNGVRHRTFAGQTEVFSLLGKLPGSVWDIPSQPLSVPAYLAVEHFAAFPMELPRRCILGWSPSGICLECGEGRRPVSDVANVEDRKGRRQRIVDYSLDAAHGPDGRGGERWRQTVRITGYACACPSPAAPTRPAAVLDPFGGTGTTALVADVLGRTGITIDRSMDYCRLAQWRTTDPAERARALGVPKPPPIPQGQMDLFGGEAS